MTLYELTDELMTILSMAEDDEDDEALQGSWEAVSGEFDDKVESYCKVIKQMDADITAIKEEEKRLASRRKRIEERIEWMKQSIMNAMRATGKRRAGGNLFTASIRGNGGKLPIVIEVDDKDVPFEFQKVSVSANKDAIRDALEAGRQLDFAHFGERGESLSIK